MATAASELLARGADTRTNASPTLAGWASFWPRKACQYCSSAPVIILSWLIEWDGSNPEAPDLRRAGAMADVTANRCWKRRNRISRIGQGNEHGKVCHGRCRHPNVGKFGVHYRPDRIGGGNFQCVQQTRTRRELLSRQPECRPAAQFRECQSLRVIAENVGSGIETCRFLICPEGRLCRATQIVEKKKITGPITILTSTATRPRSYRARAPLSRNSLGVVGAICGRS